MSSPLRAESCPCGHARDTHYLADSVAYACLSPHCACGLYGTRAVTPVRVLPSALHPAVAADLVAHQAHQAHPTAADVLRFLGRSP